MNHKDPHYNVVDTIIRFEQGELDDHQVVRLFQTLINTGLAWRLQGSYGRMAERLIEAGECYTPNYPEA